MTCEELRDGQELHALGLLEDPERMELEEHLRRGCETCARGFKRALALNAGILTLAPDVAPSPKLRKRVLASIGAPSPKWGLIAGWSTILAAMLVVGVWLSAQERQRSTELAQARSVIQKSNADLAQMQQALALLNEPETKQVIFGQGQTQPPRGRVFVNASRGVLLLAGNLPAAPAGKTYELWVIPKGGVPKPAGLFQSDTNGNALYLSKDPVDIAQTGAVAVTLEPEAGSSGPTTTPIIVAPVSD